MALVLILFCSEINCPPEIQLGKEVEGWEQWQLFRTQQGKPLFIDGHSHEARRLDEPPGRARSLGDACKARTPRHGAPFTKLAGRTCSARASMRLWLAP